MLWRTTSDTTILHVGCTIDFVHPTSSFYKVFGKRPCAVERLCNIDTETFHFLWGYAVCYRNSFSLRSVGTMKNGITHLRRSIRPVLGSLHPRRPRVLNQQSLALPARNQFLRRQSLTICETIEFQCPVLFLGSQCQGP